MKTISYRSIYSRRTHRVEACHVHIVIATKYRRKVLTRPMVEDLKIACAEVCRDLGATLKACEADTDSADGHPDGKLQGLADHVHFVVRYPATLNIPYLVQALKRRSRDRLWKKYPSIERSFVNLQKWHLKQNTGEVRSTTNLWSSSYFVETIGRATLASVRDYAENQNTPRPRIPANRGATPSSRYSRKRTNA